MGNFQGGPGDHGGVAGGMKGAVEAHGGHDTGGIVRSVLSLRDGLRLSDWSEVVSYAACAIT